MWVKSKEEICIHLQKYRNLSSYTVGRYMMRVSISADLNHKKYYATPFNILEAKPSDNQNQPVTEDQYFLTKHFTIKSGTDAAIEELCIFRFELALDLETFEIEKICKELHVQLIHCEYSQSRVVSEFRAKFKGVFSDALVMDFYEQCPGQITGSIHSCTLNYEYLLAEQTQSPKQATSKLSYKEQKQFTYKMLQYLLQLSQLNREKVQENLSQLKNSQLIEKCQKAETLTPVKASCLMKTPAKPNSAEQQFFSISVNSESEDAETELCETKYEKTQPFNKENEIVLQTEEYKIDLQHKRKRKPIFEAPIPSSKKLIGLKKSLSISGFQKKQHQNQQKIYEAWCQLNNYLMGSEGEAYIQKKLQEYERKIKARVGQSIIRFKGAKDTDVYCDNKQIQKRNIMIHQLRNTPKNNELGLEQDNEFNLCNSSFFTKQRPIFFEENVESLIEKNNQAFDLNRFDYLLVFLVHGLGACRLDMEKIKTELKRHYRDRVRVYVSSANESRTEGDIEGMGIRLAGEIEAELVKHCSCEYKICMIGHSMGGLIIRSALPGLEKIKDKFHSFVTLSSPHIGYAYSNSKLVDAGLWILNTMKKCVSIEQMTMIDKPNLEDCFLYRLSKQPGLEWFSKVTFLASHQDSYVPFYSARIQKNSDIEADFKKGSSKGISYCRMIENILSQIEGKLTRLDVNISIPQQNIDNLIGRAAHISLVNNSQMVRTFCIAQQTAIF